MAINKRLIGAGATGTGGGVTPSENFKVITYTGTGSARSITGVGFKPDLLWIKRRSSSASHSWTDSSRGNNLVLQSNETSAEASGQITLDSDGFTIGNDNALRNTNGETYVAWCWKLDGGTTSSNTDGSITATVQANPDAGFSIVRWTGTGSNGTVGHGLNSAPEFLILKDTSNNFNWYVYSKPSGATNNLRLEGLNTDSSATTQNSQLTTTSTLIENLTSLSSLNTSGANMIIYAFHSVSGYQKIGTYVGNGTNDGTFVETGFEPAFVMVKDTSQSADWNIFDNQRNTFDSPPMIKTVLKANTNSAEADQTGIKFFSNGFSVHSASNNVNYSGDTYLYWAIATDAATEQPTLASSFNIETYIGTGGARSITGLGFQPNMTWFKDRGRTREHILSDSVRGAGREISPDTADAEETDRGVGSFDTDGFSFTDGNTNYNDNGESYVGWIWKANDNVPTIEQTTADLDAIAVYKFESNVYDVTGSHNATATDVSYVSGKFNNAADFNNTSSKVVIGTQSSVIPSNSTGVSFSFWVYLDSVDTSSNYDHWFVGQENYGGSFENGEFSVRLYEGKVYTDYAQSSSIYRQRKSTTVLSTGQWYHIVATYDTSNANITEVYLNGSLETTTNLTSGGTFTTNSLMQNSSNISIGGGLTFTDGKIDQFRIYNHVLTAANVTTLYNETASDNDDLNLGMTYTESIEATVSANANAGFSIVKYEGTGIAGTKVPHGLSAAPTFIIAKRLNSSQNWAVYHTSIGATKYLELNQSGDEDTATTVWNDTAPNATTVTLGTSSLGNGSGDDYIMYCFHDVTGYQKFGSYTGNGSTQSITTGFKPDFILFKKTSDSQDWLLVDSLRGGQKELVPNNNTAEHTMSNGVSSFNNDGWTMGANNSLNTNGDTYVYWAVAKNVASNTTLANSFKVVTYTGTGSSRSVAGFGFKPDFVWGKNRDATEPHFIYDSLRGASKLLESNSTIASTTVSNRLTDFEADGFTIGGNDGSINANGNDYVAWGWKAGNTWQSNIDGSISSVTNANTANGFSVVKYTSDGTNNSTIGHGLDSAPQFILIKKLSATGDWITYHTSVGTGNFLYLNRNDAQLTQAGIWSSINSSTFNLISGYNDYNQSGQEYVAYCWTPISGYSNFGSYTGNSSSTNAITGLGFQPDLVIIKPTSFQENWSIFDSERGANKRLVPNGNDQEYTDSGGGYLASFDSDGFTTQEGGSNDHNVNKEGETYIYMAFKMN